MMSNIIQATFSYADETPETQAILQRCEEEILTRLKRTAEDIVIIGQRLIEVKQALGHGKFLAWLRTAFDMTHVMANHFMQVAERFGGKDKIILSLPVTLIYELAAPINEPIAEAVIAGDLPAEPNAIKAALAEAKEAKLRLQFIERHTDYERTDSEDDYVAENMSSEEEEEEEEDTPTPFPSAHTPLYPVSPNTPASVAIPTKGEIQDIHAALPPVPTDHLTFPRTLSTILHAIDTTGDHAIAAWLDVATPESIPDRLDDLHQIEQWCADIRHILTQPLRVMRG